MINCSECGRTLNEVLDNPRLSFHKVNCVGKINKNETWMCSKCLEVACTKEKEKAKTILRQIKEIKLCELESKKIFLHCECGKLIPIFEAYKCYYCGVWLCKSCSKDHFKVDVNELIESK